MNQSYLDLLIVVDEHVFRFDIADGFASLLRIYLDCDQNVKKIEQFFLLEVALFALPSFYLV